MGIPTRPMAANLNQTCRLVQLIMIIADSSIPTIGNQATVSNFILLQGPFPEPNSSLDSFSPRWISSSAAIAEADRCPECSLEALRHAAPLDPRTTQVFQKALAQGGVPHAETTGLLVVNTMENLWMNLTKQQNRQFEMFRTVNSQ